MRRGKAVDAQVSRLAASSVLVRKHARMLKLTRLFFGALAYHGLTPVGSQRVVIDRERAIGTAVDVVCMRGKCELVLVELKTGFGGDRAKAAPGAFMQTPVKKAKDCYANRHFAQLAVTMHLFNQEEETLAKLRAKGVDEVSGCVLYVDGNQSEKFELPEWWRKRGGRIADRIC